MYSIHSIYHLFLKCLKLLSDSFTWVSGSWTFRFAFLWRKGIPSSTLSGFVPVRQRLALCSQILTFLWEITHPLRCLAWPCDLLSSAASATGQMRAFCQTPDSLPSARTLPWSCLLRLLRGGRRVRWSHSSAANQHVTNEKREVL